MLGLKFERAGKYFRELGSERNVVTQIKKADDNQIISRTFNVYKFSDTSKVKIVNEPPPFWVGVIPDDESTLQNPLPDKFDYYYIVQTPFTITEYTGYLMYGQPIENKQELDLPPAFIDPDEVNIYKSWFSRVIDISSYDYYVPLFTGDELRWEVERLKIVIDSSAISLFNGDYQKQLNETINNLESQGFTLNITQNEFEDSKLSESVDIIATKNILNTGGVHRILTTYKYNQVVFEIEKENCAVELIFQVKNCKVYVSNDLLKDYELIFDSHVGLSSNTPIAEFKRLRTHKFIIIEPNLSFMYDYKSQLKVKPFNFKPLNNEGFSVVIKFVGRRYLHFKEEIVNVQDASLVKNNTNPPPSPTIPEISFSKIIDNIKDYDPDAIYEPKESSEPTEPEESFEPTEPEELELDLEDPQPLGIDIHEYEFVDEDSPSYWDAIIKACCPDGKC